MNLSLQSKSKNKKNEMLRQRIRRKIRKNQGFYQAARSAVNVYSKLFGNFHLLPDFLIIGAPRSGSSSLYSYLIQHHSILPCKIKEPNYFAMYYNRTPSWYRTFFPTKLKKFLCETKTKSRVVTGEASTQYYWHPHVPKRVKKLIPNTKIIILLRNPIKRSYSQYEMEVRHGNEKLSFEDAIRNEKSRISNEIEKMQRDEDYFSSKYTMYAYLEKSIYVNYIKNWLKYFRKDQFLFLKSEIFFQETESVLEKTFQFLNLPSHKFSDFKILRKGNYQPIKKETQLSLVDYFKPYNEELYSLIDQDFHWS